VFTTPEGTSHSSKNLYNRVLAPAHDRIKRPHVSLHLFLHAHGRFLDEVGESINTAEGLLGRSNLETTLNTYAHAIPGSQRGAAGHVAGVLFLILLELSESADQQKLSWFYMGKLERKW